jgi:adenosylhomocysteine nucleosidase
MILILTPLSIEHEGLKPALRDREDVLLAVGGHGKVQFALTTLHLIQKHSPHLVICAGACGALAPWLKVADVVAATTTIEHDYKLRFVQRPLPTFDGEGRVLEQLKTKSSWRNFKLHLGPIASGDEDVVDAGMAAELHARTGALAVAWEGAGGARACRFAKVPYLELRAVTDLANEHSGKKFAESIGEAMISLGQVLNCI